MSDVKLKNVSVLNDKSLWVNNFFRLHLVWDNHKQDMQKTISSQQCTHSTQGFWTGIPGQATNKKLSMDRICTGNTSNFFCNWRILGASLCLNMQTNTCTGSITQHTVKNNTHMVLSHMTQAQHSHMQHEFVKTCIHKHKDASDEASLWCKAHGVKA